MLSMVSEMTCANTATPLGSGQPTSLTAYPQYPQCWQSKNHTDDYEAHSLAPNLAARMAITAASARVAGSEGREPSVMPLF